MSFRRVLTIAALGLTAVVLVGQLRQLLDDPTVWPPDDFVEYWAAARLTLHGENPYDPNLLLPLQQLAGRKTDEAVMMWNPPWSLAIVLPLGLMPARVAQLAWLAVNLIAAGYCGDRLWRTYGGSPSRRWAGWAIVLAAMPTAFALQSGQIGTLLLLGSVLFLAATGGSVGRGTANPSTLAPRPSSLAPWPAAAGAATLLLAIKPHLAYLVWIAILFDAIVSRRWRIVVGGAAAGLVAMGMALAFNPHVVQQYLDAMGNRPPSQWVSPTLGTLLRLAFGEELFRLQFVPVAFGLTWFTWYWFKQRRTWNWIEQLPLLLLVSFVTAPYGAWPFDMVLLLPAVFQLVLNPRVSLGSASHSSRSRHQLVIAGLAAVNLGCLVLNLLAITSFWFLWVSPAVLGLYVLANSGRKAQQDTPSPTGRGEDARTNEPCLHSQPSALHSPPVPA